MSHTVQVRMIADQEIQIDGRKVNIYDITCIKVTDNGVIADAHVKEGYTGWLSKEKQDE